MNSFQGYFAAFFLTVAWVTPAAADPAKSSSLPILGENPRDAAIEAKVVNDARQFPAGELTALMEVIHACELNRSTLRRKQTYDDWAKRCVVKEEFWKAKFRKLNDPRMIDAQMRLYGSARLSLIRSSVGYYAQKEAIALKVKRREAPAIEVRKAIKVQKKLLGTSSRINKFLFALKDLFYKARKKARK